MIVTYPISSRNEQNVISINHEIFFFLTFSPSLVKMEWKIQIFQIAFQSASVRPPQLKGKTLVEGWVTEKLWGKHNRKSRSLHN